MVKPSPKKPSPSERREYSVNESNGRFKGVRMRKWGKWVAEVRLPNSRERIWLGSYESPEKAARAYDAAVYCLRGPTAKFNFPATPPEIPSASNLMPAQIQAVAMRFAHEMPLRVPPPSPPPPMTSSSSSSRTEFQAESRSKGQEEDKWPLLDEMLSVTGNGNPEFGDFGPTFDSFPECYFPEGEGGDDVEEDSGSGGSFYQSPRLWSF